MPPIVPDVWVSFWMAEYGYVDPPNTFEDALLYQKTQMTQAEIDELQAYFDYMASLPEGECWQQSRDLDEHAYWAIPSFDPCARAFQHFRDVFSGKITGPF